MQRPHDQHERERVELPFIAQLVGLGWTYLPGDIHDPKRTERASFRDVILEARLRAALEKINPDAAGAPWLDDARIDQAIHDLAHPLGGLRLLEANETATDRLLLGTTVAGDPERGHDRDQPVRYIDFADPERNDFLVVNQFRVDPVASIGDRGHIIPDLVLFVNGIPLVVVECKSPFVTNPMDEAIEQLLRYSSQRVYGTAEGAEQLFHYNQLLIATWGRTAKVGTIGALGEHYAEWKDTSPVPKADVAAALGVEQLSGQQMLVAGMLRKKHLIDLVRCFTLFTEAGGRRVKIVARYQQFRAVHEAIRRLQGEKPPPRGDGKAARRGGIIWHTQGSGKSLTMVFLVRTMRTVRALQPFKIVVVTDRTDLEKQLAKTATLTHESVERAKNKDDLEAKLREDGPGIVFGMIQKARERDDDDEDVDFASAPPGDEPMLKAAEAQLVYGQGLGEVNPSEAILMLVDEAHRSHTNNLHENLMTALPNCALIGFTGTPILAGRKKSTEDIFGGFIDRYLLEQSEKDGATVPILFEGRTYSGAVREGENLDRLFEDLFTNRTERERAAIRKKYAAEGNVLEAKNLIAAKAEDMLRHYVDNALANGFKAMIAAASRRAAVRYQAALVAAQAALVAQLEALAPETAALTGDALAERDADTQFLVRAHHRLDVIRRLEFAAVISSGTTNEDPGWKAWSDKSKVDKHVERFLKPLLHDDPAKRDGLAVLCVKSMLLTGFDAPNAQVLYLDRLLQDHDLLQGIARVNRTAPSKRFGYVVDYYGVTQHLQDALGAYSKEDAADVKGALKGVATKLPDLTKHHREVVDVFHKNGRADLANVDACVDLLRDPTLRADFHRKLRLFLDVYETFRTKPEGRPFAQDARNLGLISRMAANVYREVELNLAGIGENVRQLIDEYVESRGIDPTIAPVSILSSAFDEALSRYASSVGTKAAAIEHAARAHIKASYDEDPVRYEGFSSLLNSTLQRFEEGSKERFDELQKLVAELRKEPQVDETGLDPGLQKPFYNILVEEAGGATKDQVAFFKVVAIELVDEIRQELRIIDFWRNVPAQKVLRSAIFNVLDRHEIVPFAKIDALADRLMLLAKALHERLRV